jgi:hypothetical protein
MDDPPPASAIALEKKKLQKETNEVIEKCLAQILLIQNLLLLATYLDEIKEYTHVVTVGTRILFLIYILQAHLK